MSRPTRTRRSLLRALAPASAVGVAGCGGIGGSLDGPNDQSGDCEAVDVEPPDPVPVTVTSAAGADSLFEATLSASNRDDADHRLTITARRYGEYRPLVEEILSIRGERVFRSVDEETLSDAGPGTYVVTAGTAAGAEAQTTWRVRPGRHSDLEAVITEDGEVVFEEHVGCGVGCGARTSPASVEFPYRAPGGDDLPVARLVVREDDPDPRPRSLTVENRTDRDRTLALELHHRETRLLRYEGQVRSRGNVYLPDLVASTGEFEVRVATLSGECLAKRWSLPTYSRGAIVRFTPEWGLDFGCNPGYNTHFGVENRAGRPLDPVIELRRKGTLVQRRTLALEAGGNGTFVRSYPIGGVYRLGVATEVGHAWTEVDLCCLRFGDLTIRLTPEGPTFQQTCGDDRTTATNPGRGPTTTTDDADPP